MFYNNAFADRVARHANTQRPFGFWDIWERHSRAVAEYRHLFQQVFQLHRAVGSRQVQCSRQEMEPQSQAPVRQCREFSPWFDLARWSGDFPVETARLYGPDLTMLLRDWIKARLIVTEGAPVEWYSFAQLYLDFQLSTGHVGPLKVDKKWVNITSRPYLTSDKYTFKQRLKWFRQMMKHFLRFSAIRANMDQCRPKSGTIQAFVQSISLPWDAAAMEEVEQWLSERLWGPCVRGASGLHCLPVATLCPKLAVR